MTRHDVNDGNNEAITTIDVVIVSYNSGEIIERCLDAITDQGDHVGVIIVDNDSADNTCELARSHPIGAQVIDSGGNLGYSGAINIGLKKTTADAVLILNPDTSLHPGSLLTLRDALAVTGAGIAAPLIVNPEGEREPTIRRFPSVCRHAGQSLLGASLTGHHPALGDTVLDDEAYATVGVHDWCSGAVLLISRACLDAVGSWDESFFLYSEETDYAWRANKLGYSTVFVPDAIVEHIGGDSRHSSRLWSILVVNRVRVVRKHRGALHGTAFWFVSVVGELLRSFRPRNRTALVALVTGRKDPEVIKSIERERRRRATAVN